MDFSDLKRFLVELSDTLKREKFFVLGIVGLAVALKLALFFYEKQQLQKPQPFQVVDFGESSEEQTADNEYGNTRGPKQKNRPQRLFPFDPNTATYEDLTDLGLDGKTAHTLIKYRNAGKVFKHKEELKKVWGVSEDWYEKVSPYISLENAQKGDAQDPNFAPYSSVPYHNNTSNPKTPQIVFINSATEEDFERLPGIGKFYAHRIVSNRNKLGAFWSVEQLNDPYVALPDTVFQKVSSLLRFDSKPMRKINLNEATETELKAHPYLTKWQAEDILKNRTISGEIDLLELSSFKKEKYRKGLPYFTY